MNTLNVIDAALPLTEAEREYNARIDRHIAGMRAFARIMRDVDKCLIDAEHAIEQSGLSAAAEFISAARHVINGSSTAIIIQSVQYGLRYIDYEVASIEARRAARKALADALRSLACPGYEDGEAILIIRDFVSAALCALDNRNPEGVNVNARRGLRRLLDN